MVKQKMPLTVKQLLQKGKSQGFVTQDEILAIS